jgi:IclR family acetate operon transcriptional repressor
VRKRGSSKPTPGPGQPPAYPIASVDSALRLLKLFREAPRVRLSEAAEHLGVAHSTAHRLMAMLAYHGFVRQEPGSRAYLAGPALVEIGLAAVRELDVGQHARPVMESLAASLGETVHLAVLEGGNVRYLDAAESPRALRVASRTGSVLAANCTASGKALLAELPDAEVSAIFAGQAELTALTARSITSAARLLAELRKVRARGYAVNVEESEADVASVAVAVRGPRPQPAAALVVSAPVSRMTGKAVAVIEAELRERAAWLEGQLRGALREGLPETGLPDPDAAVGVHHRAGDPAGAVRGQEHVAARVVLSGQCDPQRRAAAQVLLTVFGGAEDMAGQAEAARAGELGAQRAARRHAVDPHFRGQFVRERDHAAADGELGGHVEHAAAAWVEARC